MGRPKRKRVSLRAHREWAAETVRCDLCGKRLTDPHWKAEGIPLCAKAPNCIREADHG